MKKRLFYGIKSISLLILLIFGNLLHAQNPFTIPTSYLAAGFQGDGNFNAVLFGNHTTSGGDTEGRLAVSGDFVHSTPGGTYSVGLANPIFVGSPDALPTTDNFIVNGTFTNSSGNNWQVQGGFGYNTAAPLLPLPTSTYTIPGTPGLTNHINFTGLLTRYKATSTYLSTLVANGSISGGPTDPIILTGTDPALNVFDVTLPPVLQSRGFDINVPAGSTVLINISNVTPSINSGNFTINGVVGAASLPSGPTYGIGSHVLLNFYNATSLTLETVGVAANVLAPFSLANSFSGGSINGQSAIGGNVSQLGGFEFHNFTFSGMLDLSPLPVTLIRFEVAAENRSANLHWITSAETNSEAFMIQRSPNARNWISVGTVSASGESAEKKFYSFTDKSPLSGIGYYRLKMMDRDGTHAYSTIRKVQIETPGSYLYPNPIAGGLLNIYSKASIKNIQLTDNQGKYLQHFSEKTTALNIDSLTSGIYWLRLTDNDGNVEVRKFTILK